MPKIVIITGPSGGGKTTVMKELLKNEKYQFVRIVTCTTRQPREGELAMKDYVFLSREEYRSQLVFGNIIAPVVYEGEYYGVLRAQVESTLASGKNAILTLDHTGAKTFLETYPGLVRSFYLTASRLALFNRCVKRGMSRASADDRLTKDPPLPPEEVTRRGHFFIHNRVDELGRTIGIIDEYLTQFLD